MKKVLLTAFAFLIGIARAGDECVCRYELVSKGITVGNAEAIRSHVLCDGAETTRCDVKTKVDVRLIFVNVHLDGTENAWIGPDGVVAFNIKSDHDGKHLETSGGMTNGIFHCVRAEAGVTNRFEIARTNYVASTLDGLELKLVKGGPAVTNRVFDCSRGAAFDRTYRWLDNAELEIGGKKITCRIIEFRDDQKSGKRWVYEDGYGMAIARQDAKEPSGSYSLRLKETITRPATAAH